MSILRNFSISIAGKGVGAVLQLGGTMVVSRLMTPDELGVFAVAAGFVGVLTGLRNFGTSNYIVQAPLVDRHVVGSAFSVTAGISWALGLLIVISASHISRFFNADEVESVLFVLALNFLLSPFVMTGLALLQREQDFFSITVIELIAGVIGLSVTVGLVYLEWGPIALAIGMLVNALTVLLLILAVHPRGLTFFPSYMYLESVLKFGGWASGVTLLNQIKTHSPVFVLGKALGVGAGAMYDKGSALSRILWDKIFDELMRVLLPRFAAENRNSENQDESYLYRLSLLFTVAPPMFFFLAFHSKMLIYFLFGDQWGEAAPVASLIAIGTGALAPFAINQEILIAAGRVRDVFFVKLAETFVFVLSLVVLIGFGLIAGGIALIIASAAFIIVSQRMTSRRLKISAARLLQAMKEPLIVVSLVSIVNLALSILFARGFGSHSLTGVFSSLCGTAITWYIACKYFDLPAHRLVNSAVRSAAIFLIPSRS